MQLRVRKQGQNPAKVQPESNASGAARHGQRDAAFPGCIQRRAGSGRAHEACNPLKREVSSWEGKKEGRCLVPSPQGRSSRGTSRRKPSQCSRNGHLQVLWVPGSPATLNQDKQDEKKIHQLPQHKPWDIDRVKSRLTNLPGPRPACDLQLSRGAGRNPAFSAVS